MSLAYLVGTEAGRHRFPTLAFAGKKQARAIGLQRHHSIQVPRGMRQAIQISREAFLLGAWRYRVGAHDPQLIIKECWTGKSFSRRYSVYNTVVLESIERDYIIRVLQESRGLIAGPNGAAARLRMKRTT